MNWVKISNAINDFKLNFHVTLSEGCESGYCHNLAIAIVPIMFTYLWQQSTKSGGYMGNESLSMDISLHCCHRYSKFMDTMAITILWQMHSPIYKPYIDPEDKILICFVKKHNIYT